MGRSVSASAAWNVNDSAITVIMIRKRTQRSTSLLHPLPSIWHFETRELEMAPFGSVVARIRALQDPINQLQYNRRECQQLVDHTKAFIASLKEKSHAQNLSDLQRNLLQ